MAKRARDFAKLHHPDPSGFWNLVRTGEKLPVPGQEILYVVDIRGTRGELERDMWIRVAAGDPHKIGLTPLQERADKGEKIYEHEVLTASLFTLPTTKYPPTTKHGVVEAVEFDSVLGDWLIFVYQNRGFWGSSPDCDTIVYWAPMPGAPDTYTPRTGDDDDAFYFNGCRSREQRVLDYLETRKARKNNVND